MDPPQGFVQLARAHESPDQTFVSIIGIVVDIMPPTQTRMDHLFTFKLLDRSLTYSLVASDGLVVRIFNKSPDLFPKVRSIGDVVLLRHAKMMTFQNQRVCLGNFQTRYLVFPSATIPSPTFSIAYSDKNRIECSGIPPSETNTLNLAEQQYVMNLKQDMRSATEERVDKLRTFAAQREIRQLEQPEGPPLKKQKAQLTSGLGKKFRLIEELQPGTWADISGIVVKSIGAGYGGVDLYVTDYTPNELMRYYPPPEEETEQERDGDDFGYSAPPRKGWPGPYQYLVLKVNLKSPHAEYANRHVKEGDFVLLQNVKMRITDIAKLEGDMWPDDESPERVKIRKVEHLGGPEILALTDRKVKYWKARDARNAQVNGQGLGKKARKKQRKREREAAAAAAAAEAGQVPSGDDQEASNTAAKKRDKNPHVRCSHEEIPVTRICEIRDLDHRNHVYKLPGGRSHRLPFINANYRAKVRVVDFEPKALDEFAVPPEPDEDASVDSMAWQYDTPQYEWYFSLLLEDATRSRPPAGLGKNHRIWVHVHHQEAQFLLGNNIGDPDDLRHNTQLLAKLREKMFLLWGNLQEDEGKNLSNLPFECCIMEYGIERDQAPETAADPMSRWERVYGMFGTTIL